VAKSGFQDGDFAVARGGRCSGRASAGDVIGNLERLDRGRRPGAKDGL